jgi:hypothetical protein
MTKSCLNCRKMGVCKWVDFKIYKNNYTLEERKVEMENLSKSCEDYLVI